MSLLRSLQVFIVSSLRSRHRVILNEAIAVWNETFGAAKDLEYPLELQKAVLKLQNVSDIVLPGLPHIEDSEVMTLVTLPIWDFPWLTVTGHHLTHTFC